MSAVPMSTGDPPRAGFHGKVPTKGDFIQSRLPRSFIDPWDAWLQGSVDLSRQALGDGWLSHYLTSPVWRFALAAGACGADCVAGVMIPSVDRVGRYYPFLVAVPLPLCGNAAALPGSAAAWYDEAERLALTSLDDDFTIDRMESLLDRLGLPESGIEQDPVPPLAPAIVREDLIAVPTGQTPGFPALYALAMDRMLAAVFPAYTFWWTAGSDRVQSCCLMARGMPPASIFAAFLDGDWPRWSQGWLGAAAMARSAGPDDELF